MKVRVKSENTICYNQEFYAQGDTFEIEDREAERLSDYLEVLEADKTVAQLKEIAEQMGIEIPKRIKKADLVELIESAE